MTEIEMREIDHKIKCWACEMPRDELISNLKAVRDYHVNLGAGSFKDHMCRVIDAYEEADCLDELNGGQIGDFVLYGYQLENTYCVLGSILGKYKIQDAGHLEYINKYMKELPTFFDDLDMNEFGSTEELFIEFDRRITQFKIEMDELIEEVNN